MDLAAHLEFSLTLLYYAKALRIPNLSSHFMGNQDGDFYDVPFGKLIYLFAQTYMNPLCDMMSRWAAYGPVWSNIMVVFRDV